MCTCEADTWAGVDCTVPYTSPPNITYVMNNVCNRLERDCTRVSITGFYFTKDIQCQLQVLEVSKLKSNMRNTEEAV